MLSALSLTACSDDSFAGDAPKDWAGTTTAYEPTDEAGFSTFYTPAIGRVGDPMPFYDQKAGNFKVMYLQEYDNNGSCYHPFWAVETSDGASYKSLGEWLPTASYPTEQDAALGTGCCYYNEKDQLYYIYYTGHSDALNIKEAVMRATSPDLKTWTKDNSWTLYGKDSNLSSTDFRDPQIFQDGSTYHMIIATKPATGGDPCFADYTSADMKDWKFESTIKMIWDRFLECPDVFQMNGYWYMVYSESTRTSWSRKVKYMMAKSWDELKKCFNEGPKWPDEHEGILDTRAFYAGKTASNGTDRYIWGWCPFRVGGNMYEKNVNVGAGEGNEPAWSGALVCHKLQQNADGTLTCVAVPGLAAKYSQQKEVKVIEQNKDYTLYSRLGKHNHISFTVKTAGQDDKFGISFVRSSDNEKYYTLTFNNPHDNNKELRHILLQQDGSDIFIPEEDGEGYYIKGPVVIDATDGYFVKVPEDNTYKIDIYTDNSVMVMYVNNNTCYTGRIYGIEKNCWSINTYTGSITVSDLKISEY